MDISKRVFGSNVDQKVQNHIQNVQMIKNPQKRDDLVQNKNLTDNYKIC